MGWNGNPDGAWRVRNLISGPRVGAEETHERRHEMGMKQMETAPFAALMKFKARLRHAGWRGGLRWQNLAEVVMRRFGVELEKA